MKHFSRQLRRGLQIENTMTVKALINELQAILDRRGGEDLNVMLNADLKFIHHSACATYMNDLSDLEDHVLISSVLAEERFDKWEREQKSGK